MGTRSSTSVFSSASRETLRAAASFSMSRSAIIWSRARCSVSYSCCRRATSDSAALLSSSPRVMGFPSTSATTCAALAVEAAAGAETGPCEPGP